MTRETCACKWCGRPTAMTFTKECDRCHELVLRVRLDPELARRVLAEMEKEDRGIDGPSEDE